MAKNQQRPERPKVKQEANPDLEEDRKEKREEGSSEKDQAPPNSNEEGDFDFPNDDWEPESEEDFEAPEVEDKADEPEPEAEEDFSTSFDFEKEAASETSDLEYGSPPSEPSSTGQNHQGTQAGSVEIPWDKNTSYFFMYGVKGAGKTVILSGLFYNVFAHRIGDRLQNLNDASVDHQKRGSKLLNDMLEQVPNGAWPPSTSTLNSEGKLVPRQINIEFQPNNPKKPEFKFCVMDMSGEDLMRIRPDSDYDDARFDPGIEEFLRLPHQNLAFICVYPAVSNQDPARMSSYVQLFLDELGRIGHQSTPIILIVSQWDRVAKDYASPTDFLQKKAPIIWARLSESGREATIMAFSIGDVDGSTGKYSYNPESSNKLFGWMYRTQMGTELDEEVSPGLWKKIMQIINGN